MDFQFDDIEITPFSLPREKGVYAVCVKNGYGKKFKERIVYIGSSNNLFKRVQNQKHPYMLCCGRFKDKVVYVKAIVCENYKELEKSLISIYKPLLNKTLKHG